LESAVALDQALAKAPRSVSAMGLSQLMQFTTFSGGRPRALSLLQPHAPSSPAAASSPGSWRESRAAGIRYAPSASGASTSAVQQSDRLLGLRLMYVGRGSALQ
jgi:hypothetical protein